MPTSKYLIVGLGSIGKRHLGNLHVLRPHGQVAAWRSGQRDQAAPIAGCAHQFDSLEQVAAFAPDAAIIAGPASVHLAQARQLVELGIPLLIEKPFSISSQGLDQLIKQVESKRLPLMLGYNLRFMPSLRETRRLVQSGHIGRILSVRAEVGQYLPDWRPGSDYRQTVSARADLGGGALLELSHELDYLYWIFGLPQRLSCHGGRLSELDIEVEDTVEICLQYTDPARIVSVHLDFIQRAACRSCKFIGTEGTLVWDGIADSITCYQAAAGQWSALDGFRMPDRNAMYLDELAHFLDCVEQRLTPAIDARQGRDVMRMIDTARRAMLAKTTEEIVFDAN